MPLIRSATRPPTAKSTIEVEVSNASVAPDADVISDIGVAEESLGIDDGRVRDELVHKLGEERKGVDGEAEEIHRNTLFKKVEIVENEVQVRLDNSLPLILDYSALYLPRCKGRLDVAARTDFERAHARALCTCRRGCRRRPGSRRECPNCGRLVGPGCCWNPEQGLSRMRVREGGLRQSSTRHRLAPWS